jgi:hypothetical protein
MRHRRTARRTRAAYRGFSRFVLSAQAKTSPRRQKDPAASCAAGFGKFGRRLQRHAVFCAQPSSLAISVMPTMSSWREMLSTVMGLQDAGR